MRPSLHSANPSRTVTRSAMRLNLRWTHPPILSRVTPWRRLLPASSLPVSDVMCDTPGMQHPSGIPEKIVRKVVARRGRLHAFETLEPRSTALVVIDLDVATVGRDDAAQGMI